MTNEKLRAACGLDCKQCPAYTARETNDNELRAKTAAEWSAAFGANFLPEQINCISCLIDGVHGGYCSVCPVRACVISKDLPNCHSCSDFSSCQIRKDFEAHSGLKMEELFAKEL